MPDTIAGTTATTSTLALNSSNSGTIDTAGDQDWFRISLTAGTTYTFRQDRAIGSSLDSYLRLMNSIGTLIDSNDDGGGNGNSLLTYTPTTSGTYYIAAGGFTSSTGAYSLLATAAQVDNAGNTQATARDLGALGTATQTFNDWVGSADTNDYYKFVLSGTRNLRLTLNGMSQDADVELLNASGAFLRDSKLSGTNIDTINFDGLVAGTYYIRVWPGANYTTLPNTNYSLSLRAEMPVGDNAGNAQATARDLGTLGTATQTFNDWVGSADTNDYYKFVLSGTRNLRLTLNGMSQDADVELRSASGAFLRDSKLSGTNIDTINFDGLVAGTYYIRVRPGANYTTPQNTNYSLSLRAEMPVGDITAPRVTAFSPADGASGVSVGRYIVASFNEPIKRGTGAIQLRSGSATGLLVQSFDAASSAGLSISGSTLTIDPTANLANNTQYFVTFANGAIRDLAGNAYVGTTTYDFRTVAAAAPEVAVTGNGVNIVDNDAIPGAGDHTDFGSVTQNAAITRTFTVRNTGTASLTTSGLTVPTGFTITELLSPSIAAGGSDSFTVRMDTSTAGAKSGQISFTNNDSDESAFNFAISGVVTNKTALEIFRAEGTKNWDGNTTGISFTGEVRVLADFAKAAYSLQTWETASIGGRRINDPDANAVGAYNELTAQGWTPLNLSPTLSTSSTVAGQAVTNRMLGGYFTNGNAAAFVARSSDAVVISFRGTNDNGTNTDDATNSIHPDVDQWQHMNEHYALLQPFIAAVDAYVADSTNGIRKVYVTGHSLGGAMAIEYMSLHTGSLYEAVSFAAPVFAATGQTTGYSDPPLTDVGTKRYARDSRLTQIEVFGDPVPMTHEIGPNTFRPGNVIRFEGNGTMSRPDEQKVPWLPDYMALNTNHSMDYYRQIADSVDNSGWQQIWQSSQAGKPSVLLGGTQSGSNFVVDGRQSPTGTIMNNGNDTLSDPSNVDYSIYYGGRGDDDLTGGGASEILLGGEGTDDLYGNGDVDKLDGGPGRDFLWGGAGKDKLTGGSEADTFYFFQPSDGRDAITDFQSGTDKIWVKSVNFANIPQGLLTDARFFAGSTPSATNSNAAFLYNTSTGVLTFDSNGSGLLGRTEIATLVNRPTNFRASDIQLVA